MKKEELIFVFPQEITLDRVYTAYNGKVGCMCGCNGDYAYAEQHREFASKNRGYVVTDDEISDSKVKRRYNAIKNHKFGFLVSDEYVYIEYGERCACIYYK